VYRQRFMVVSAAKGFVRMAITCTRP